VGRADPAGERRAAALSRAAADARIEAMGAPDDPDLRRCAGAATVAAARAWHDVRATSPADGRPGTTGGTDDE